MDCLRSSALGLNACLLTFFVALGLVACQPGENQGHQSDEPVDTAAVKSALDSMRQVFISAYEAGDAEKNASLWTEDIRQATPFSPPVRGRDTIEAMNRRWFESNPATREVTLDTVRDVRVLSEDWAYTYTTWTFRVTPEDTGQTETMTATYLILYRKTPGGWKAHVEAGSPHSAPGE